MEGGGGGGGRQDLSGDCDLLIALIAQWTLAAVRVIKRDGDRGLCDAGLASLVDQFLQVPCSDLHIYAHRHNHYGE